MNNVLDLEVFRGQELLNLLGEKHSAVSMFNDN